MHKRGTSLFLALLLSFAAFLTACGKTDLPPDKDSDKSSSVVDPIDPVDPIPEYPYTELLEGLILYPAPQSYRVDGSKSVSITGKTQVDAAIEENALAKTNAVLSQYFTDSAVEKADILIAQDLSLAKSGYTITVDASGVNVRYRDGEGAYYAAVTLNQLFDQLGVTLPYLEIEDYPDLEMRGFDLDIARGRVPSVVTMKSLIDDLAALKINTLMLYIEFPSTILCDLFADIQGGDRGLTVAECKEIDAYAKQNYIDVIPFIETIGHLENILVYPQYVDVREVYSAGCTTVCVQNPDAQQLLADMIDVVIDCFDSEYFMIGGDESYEIGTGQSLTYLPGANKLDVYLDSVKIIYDMLQERGKKMILAHDMLEKFYVSGRAKIRAAFEEMPNSILVYWEYEEDSAFTNTAFFDNLNIDYILMPSTNCFGSVAGRLSTAEANLKTGVKVAIDKQKIGVLTATFGDGGYRNALTAEYNPLAYSAGLCWNYNANLDETEKYLAYVGRYIFGESKGNELVEAWELMQRYNDVTGRSWGQSLLVAVGNEHFSTFQLFHTYMNLQPGTGTEKWTTFIGKMDEVIARADALKEVLKRVELTAARGDEIKAEMEVSADQIILLAEYVKMRVLLYAELATEESLQDKAAEMYYFGLDLFDRYREVWLMVNQFGLLEDSINWMSGPLKLFGNVGDVFEITDTDNLLFLSPDKLSFLDERLFSKSYLWNGYGKAYPTVSVANGINTTNDIKAMMLDGSLTLLSSMTGVSGKVFAINRRAMRENFHFNYFYGDPSKNSLLDCMIMWPGMFNGVGVYEATCKVRFESGRAVDGNIVVDGCAWSDGIATLYNATITYSQPDENGWVTVTYRYNNVNGYRYISLGVNPKNELGEDKLFISELVLKKIEREI